MRRAYNNISPLYGRYRAGICAILIAPKEWITTQLEPDFETGIITTPASFMAGKAFITLEMIEQSYEMDEKAKTAKAGPYYDTAMSGIINDITPELLQTLETLRYHQFIAVLKDKQGRYKLFGNKDEGMEFNFSNSESNDQGGLQQVKISMDISQANASPFYQV